MRKGKEIKRRMAALLIAAMTAGNMATPVFAEPGTKPAGGTTVVEAHNLDWSSSKRKENVTIYCAGGQNAEIYEEENVTKMKLADGTVVDLVPQNKVASASNTVAVYAGTWDGTDVDGPVELTMKSGEVDYLIGGSAAVASNSNVGFAMEESSITMTGGTVQDLMANRPAKNPAGFDKCGENVIGTCTLNLSGGTVEGQLGGTFSYSKVGTLNVNVTGGNVGFGGSGFYSRLVLAGTNGCVDEANLSVTKGKIKNISTGLRTLVGEVNMSITGGEVGEIFAGSLYPDEETSEGAKTAGNKNPWAGGNVGNVDYGVAEDVKVTVGGNTKYKGIYGGFQHGIKASSSDATATSSEAQLFLDTYSNIPEAIKEAYKFGNLDTNTVINYSVEPQEKKDYKYTKNLLTDETDGVTVNNYVGSSITLSETTANMKLGENKTLTAGFNLGETATSSDANYEWSSSDPEIVTVRGVDEEATLEAIGDGSAIITVNCNGVLATCTVTVAKPKLSVSLRSKMDYADEDTYLTAKVDNVAGDLADNVTYEAAADRAGLSCEEDEDGSFLITPNYGLSGDYEITVTANVGDGYEFKETKTLTVNKPKFSIAVTEGSKSLDVKGAETAALEAIGDYDDYDTYEWSVEGDAIRLASSSDLSEEVTAVKAGTATVRVKAVRDSLTEGNGPDASADRETIPAATAEAKITITVADTRKFEADKAYVELDINPESAKLSDTVKITNDYEDNLRIEVLKSTQPVTAELKDGVLTIATTARETGSATVVLTRENGDKITIPVVIKTTAIAAEVKSGIEITVKDDAVSAPKVKTEGLTEEQAAEAQTQAAQAAEEIKNAIKEAYAKITENEEAAEELAARTSGMDDVAMDYMTDNGLKVENGDIVKVYSKQELQNVELESATTVNEETGEVTVSTVIKSMTIDISVMLDKMNENGEVVAGGTLNIPATNKKPVSFPVVLPSEGISPEMRYVKVTHKGEISYFPIRESNGVKFAVITTYSFSPFNLEFVEKVPTANSHSSRSGGRSGGSSSTGRWIQDGAGWKYLSSGVSMNNCWKQLLWNSQMQWYHFDAAGYMTAGWFVDVDGNRYFLHNISDGGQGRMYTGWNQIAGQWYYFKENEGGPKGSLLVNGVTPDGHQTDANGACASYQPQ